MSVVSGLQAHLDRLFSPAFATSHVLRAAGINSASQVTLCIAAICTNVDVNTLNAQFNVVLFGNDDFRQFGGETFRDMRVFQQMKTMSKKTD